MKKRLLLSLVIVMVLLLVPAVAGATGTKTISAQALSDHSCDSTEWHFVITQISEPILAPPAISVQWANGISTGVILDRVTGGVAHYSTTANLSSTVVNAWTEIYADWDGQFNLSHGPDTCPEPPPPPPVTNTLEATPAVDCEGWSITVWASEGATIYGHPGLSGDWVETSSVVVSVTAIWSSGEPLSVSWEQTLYMPEDCGVIPPPPPPPPPQDTPTPVLPPWEPGAYQCTVITGTSGTTYEIYWIAGDGSIGGLSQPAQELGPNGEAQVFFSNNGNYIVVANSAVIARFSMPGCAPMDAPPATPAPSTGSGGPSTPSSLAGVGAIGFLAVLLGGAVLFVIPRRFGQG